MDNNYLQDSFAHISHSTLHPLKLLVLQPTPFCNINCDYCYLPQRSSKRFLSLDLLEKIFRNLFASTLIDTQCTVVWHAGEPCAMPLDFYEKAFQKIHELNAKNYRILHSMQTNGTLISEAWCEFIKKHNIHIGISIDGPAFIHDAHRKTRSGKGTHSSVMRGIELLRSYGIDFHAIAVITQQSLNFADEIFRFFLEQHITRVGFNIEEIEGMNTSSSLQKSGTETRYVKFMRRINELTKNAPQSFVVREFEHILNFIVQDSYIEQSEQTIPFSMLSIDCDGNFTTFSPEFLGLKSLIYGDFVLGNVENDTFESVYTSQKFQKIYQDITNGVELCRNTCEYFPLCGGGAPVNKYFENGTLCSTETMYCRYTVKIPVNLILDDLEGRVSPEYP